MEGEQECTYEQCFFLFVRLQRNHEVEKIAQPIMDKNWGDLYKNEDFSGKWNLPKSGTGHRA